MILLFIVSLGLIGMMLSFLFAFAIYALPFAIAVWAGTAAYHSGAGVIGGALVGIIVGGLAWGFGQGIFAFARSGRVRGAVALVYVGPAAFAGYHAVHGLAKIGVPSEAWRVAFSIVGAIIVAASAFARLVEAPHGVGRLPNAPSPLGSQPRPTPASPTSPRLEQVGSWSRRRSGPHRLAGQ